MLTTSININLDPEKGGKWYATENKTKRGDVKVTFFQRDGKQTFLQKFKDFRSGVRSGTELASKYSKELGLPAEAFSNPKTKNAFLNNAFREAVKKLKENESFKSTEPLVSHSDMDNRKRIDITVNTSKITTSVDKKKYYEVSKEVKIHNFKINLNRNDQANSVFTSHLRLAFDARDNPDFSATKDEMEAAKKSLIDIKKAPLRLGDYQIESEQKKEFDLTVNDLLKPLEVKFFLTAIHNHNPLQSQIELPTHAIGLAVDIREISPNGIKAEEATKAYEDLLKFKTESEGQPWFNEVSSNLDSLISIALRKTTINIFFKIIKDMNVDRTERNSILDSIYRAISIRENLPNRISIESKQSDYEKLKNFRKTYSEQEGFNVISKQLDDLITVLENNLLSLNQTAQT